METNKTCEIIDDAKKAIDNVSRSDVSKIAYALLAIASAINDKKVVRIDHYEIPYKY